MPEVDSLEIKIDASSNDAAEHVNRLAQSLENLQKAASGGGLSAAKKGIDSISQSARNAVVKDASATINVEGADLAESKVSALDRILSSLMATAYGTGDSLRKLGQTAKSSLVSGFETAAKSANKWKMAIGRIVFYRTIRSAIRAVTQGFATGINNLYQYSLLVRTDFAPAMDKLATSSLYLKNSLGTLAAPLIETLAPVIDILVDKIVDLFNAISRLFAYLQGKDVYTAAKKHAVQYKEAADDAYKATKKFLLGIDELNIFDPGAGGATSALEDYGGKVAPLENHIFQVNHKLVGYECPGGLRGYV